jgi:two-component system, response regulator PdtaR
MMLHSDFNHAPFAASPFDRSGDEVNAAERQEATERIDKAGSILIVEDDFLIAMQAENALTDAGFSVSGVATTAKEALEMAKQRRPAIVVMDIRLAGRRDGIDAAGDLATLACGAYSPLPMTTSGRAQEPSPSDP